MHSLVSVVLQSLVPFVATTNETSIDFETKTTTNKNNNKLSLLDRVSLVLRALRVHVVHVSLARHARGALARLVRVVHVLDPLARDAVVPPARVLRVPASRDQLAVS